MADHEGERLETIAVPVREGPYQYVLVHDDGSSETIPVDEVAYEAGAAAVEVASGDRVMEVALSSTSDPDLAPPRGQLWPPGGGDR